MMKIIFLLLIMLVWLFLKCFAAEHHVGNISAVTFYIFHLDVSGKKSG